MKKALIVILSVLLAVLAGAGAYVYNLLDLMDKTILVDPDTNEPISEDPEERRESLGISETAPDQKETGVINILLFGLDYRSKKEPGHSDAIIIASIDKTNKTIKLTSLMRDMYVPIPGKKDNRINTAYFMGGPSLAIKTVNTNFDMDIEDYITVDFFALEDIIDGVGGIPIDVKKNEIKVLNQYLLELNNISPKKNIVPDVTKSGLQTLNGRQAVAYARIRYVGRDDFDRTERQRRVLNELFKKGKTISLTKLPDLVTKFLPQVETSLTKTEILDLAITVLGFGKTDIEQFRIPADGTYTDEWVSADMLVLMPDIKKNKELLLEFIYDQPSIGVSVSD